MASPIRTTGFLLHLDKSEFVETWIKYLVPHVRGKKLKDKKEYEGDNEMIGVFFLFGSRRFGLIQEN